MSTNHSVSELNVDLKFCHAEMSYPCLHAFFFDFQGDSLASDLVSAIDPLVYPIGAWETSLPPLGPIDLESPFESDLTVCRSSSPHACDYSMIDYVAPRQNLHHHMEYCQFTSPFRAVDPPCLHDFPDF
jgi:hypothetical protein